MSQVVTAAPPLQYLTTLARVKALLGITGTASDTRDNDDLFSDMIGRASSEINYYCGRPKGFGVLAMTETLKGTGSQILAVTYTPILTIASVYEDGELLTPINPADPSTFLQEGYYVEDAEAGAIYRAAGWRRTLAPLMWGHEAYSSRYILAGDSQEQRYIVAYTAGYFLPGQEQDALQDHATGNDPWYDMADASSAPPLPGAVEQACIETVKYWWFTRKRDYTLMSGQVDNVRAQLAAPFYQTTTALPPVALGLLRNHRRV